MGMDRNTVIGFILIGALLIAMFYINSKNRLEYEAGQKRIQDSIAALQPKVKQDTSSVALALKDSIAANKNTAVFQDTVLPEQKTTIENNLLKITFTNKGARPERVELKQFKKYDGTPVVLNDGPNNKFSYKINIAENKTTEVENLVFKTLPVVKNTDNSTVLRFVAEDTLGRKITHQYTLRENDYMVDFSIDVEGAGQLFSQNTVSFFWQTEAQPIEKDHKYELTQTHICYLDKEGYNFEYIGKGDNKSFANLNWLAMKQQFFVNALISKNNFTSLNTNWTIPADTTQKYLARLTSTGQMMLNNSSNQSIPFQLYYGPSDYNVLKKYDNKLENIVPLGSGMFAFVKYINRHLLLPVFDFFQRYIASMGIVILLLTLMIRLITSPILYKSYLSGAKMKVLKPEVDALREKYKDDQQTFGMEQMKLWRSAGVNPLGGCLPALLQIPIFMSLYYFFQSNIDLRGKSFLWAKDLASYDTIANLPFEIPFYGDHVSLFTLTAVTTSLLISLYSMTNMQDNSNPMMKYMPYIFPVMLLGVFNKLPAALTWYYTISNFITLVLQFVIQKYIIDHDKIMLQIAENRKKPVKKSKLQERIDAMQETQKKLQDMKKK